MLQVTTLCSLPTSGQTLPALQAVPVSQMEDGEQIVVRNHVVFSGFDVKRKQDEENFIAKQPVPDVAIKRNQRGVILVRVRRALLKIKREKREPPGRKIVRVLPAGKTEQLGELPAIFHPEPLVGQHRIKQIKFLRLRVGIGVIGKQGRNRPGPFRISLLIIKKRTGGFGAVAGNQRQRKFIEDRAGVELLSATATGSRT